MIEDFVSKIAWLGHDTFRISSGKIIYIDPYQIKGGPKADLILVSHDHFDHCSADDVAKLQKPGTIIVTEADSAKKLRGDVRVLAPGDSLQLADVHIRAVPAYNTDKAFHPRGKGWLGFVVTVDGVRIYHAGDSDFIPEMSQLEVDIALLPVSGTYVMTAEQAVEAALAIGPKLAIPMHYGAIVGGEEDARRFARALEGKLEVKILQPQQ